MADKTGISWTDATWPVVTGCTHISEGCDNCYAARLTSGRLKHLPAYAGLAEHGKFNGTVRLLPERLAQPAHWQKPRRIFVSDMADLFHQDVPDGYIAQVWDVMGRHQQHTYQILTKRHARMKSWVTRWADHAEDGPPRLVRGPEAVRAAHPSGRGQLFAAMVESMGDPPSGYAFPSFDWAEGQRWWPSELFNVWGGVSAENQHWANLRVPALQHTPFAIRYLSLEPLLGPINLSGLLDGIGWVIAGGESGPGHRDMDIAWLESVVAQCRDAGVPVHVKQASGPRPGMQGDIPDDLWALKQFPEDVAARG